jgi:hypothetical protein
MLFYLQILLLAGMTILIVLFLFLLIISINTWWVNR